ncbi:MAG: FAD-binding oxidoreductase [Desulfobacteraceae bacterium]|nr:FAD-binding oxidoreductase [Desulfobacteraceae bacterium]
MNNNITHGLWADTAPAAPSLSSFEGEREADIVIIGGGYTGLSAALHLAEQGTDIVLLEAEHIGFGGAGRNVGLVNAGLWLMPDDVVKIIGKEYGERVIEELGKSPDLVFDLIEKHGIECEAMRKGTLHCADSPGGLKALRQREEQWQKRGAPVRLLSKEESESKIGSKKFHGALLDLRAGTLQPLAYAHGLAHAAKTAGADLFVKSPVIKVEQKDKKWKITTLSGIITAKAVIQACQGYASHGFKDNMKTLIPFNFFQFATKPLPEEIRRSILPEGHGAWDTNLILSSYRIDAAGRLVVGSVGSVDKFGHGLHKNWAKRTINKVFPQINDAQPDYEIEYGWFGRIAMTQNHVPRFHVYADNNISVTSFNGRGIGPGTLFGKLMAEYFLNDSNDNIPLPVSNQKNIITRGVRGIAYEAGARAYHFIQRRV